MIGFIGGLFGFLALYFAVNILIDKNKIRKSEDDEDVVLNFEEEDPVVVDDNIYNEQVNDDDDGQFAIPEVENQGLEIESFISKYKTQIKEEIAEIDFGTQQ